MLKRLQNKWKVSGIRLLLILTTFALGGSLCGYLGRKILGLLTVDKAVWVVLYILLITLLWPLCVLLISIPFGQFAFFRNYIKRIASKMFGRKKIAGNTGAVTRVAVFASGTGSNAEKLIAYFRENPSVTVAVVVSNNPQAGVLDIAKKAGVPAAVINLKNKETEAAVYTDVLHKYDINFIVLAGWLKKIPAEVIKLYPEKIVNIHPALLPAYGGAGMYGNRVHEAVINAGEKQSGISIHYVDELYDNGKVIFQKTCEVDAQETPASLAKKIHALEHEWYGRTLKEIIPG